MPPHSVAAGSSRPGPGLARLDSWSSDGGGEITIGTASRLVSCRREPRAPLALGLLKNLVANRARLRIAQSIQGVRTPRPMARFLLQRVGHFGTRALTGKMFHTLVPSLRVLRSRSSLYGTTTRVVPCRSLRSTRTNPHLTLPGSNPLPPAPPAEPLCATGPVSAGHAVRRSLRGVAAP